MTNLVVRYFEEVSDPQGGKTLTPLGSETLEGVSEALLPGFSPDFKVFCTKKFASSGTYNWFVARVTAVPGAAGSPASFEVVLEQPYVSGPVEYLNQTVRKTGASVEKTLRPGSLVEVDYGFVQSIGKEDGSLKTNKRYSDTIQKGEMHKRRLCIVVKSQRTTIQVVPITSVPPDASDKKSFQIDPANLSNLVRYGASGKDSYALCGMIETVSIRRVLPPEAFYKASGRTRQGRSVAYPTALNGADTQRLREALLHGIGVVDYLDVKSDLVKYRKKCLEMAPLPAELAATQAYVRDLEARTLTLERYRRLASRWAGELGLDLEGEAAKFA